MGIGLHFFYRCTSLFTVVLHFFTVGLHFFTVGLHFKRFKKKENDQNSIPDMMGAFLDGPAHSK